MRKIFAGLLVALVTVVGLGTSPAIASATVSNASGVMTGQTASSADPGYYGLLSAKTTSTACVVAEWKDAGAQWRRHGFHQGQFEFSELRVCYNNVDTSEEYRIHIAETGPLYGLRFVSNTGQIKVLCENTSGTTCAAKLA